MFRAVYPGADPWALTESVYRALLNEAARASAFRGGRWEEVERMDAIARSNREIVAQEWFRNLFPQDEPC